METTQSHSSKPRVYVETSVISYLAARPSRDVGTLYKQQITQDFWRTRSKCELFASDAVIREASAGNKSQANARLDFLRMAQLVQTTDIVQHTALALIADKAIPVGSEEDALHVALCAHYQMNYLLTWNCKHIANPVMQERINASLLRQGLNPAYLITPEVYLSIHS